MGGRKSQNAGSTSAVQYVECVKAALFQLQFFGAKAFRVGTAFVACPGTMPNQALPSASVTRAR